MKNFFFLCAVSLFILIKPAEACMIIYPVFFCIGGTALNFIVFLLPLIIPVKYLIFVRKTNIKGLKIFGYVTWANIVTSLLGMFTLIAGLIHPLFIFPLNFLVFWLCSRRLDRFYPFSRISPALSSLLLSILFTFLWYGGTIVNGFLDSMKLWPYWISKIMLTTTLVSFILLVATAVEDAMISRSYLKKNDRLPEGGFAPAVLVSNLAGFAMVFLAVALIVTFTQRIHNPNFLMLRSPAI
jgi:hypothetical protein